MCISHYFQSLTRLNDPFYRRSSPTPVRKQTQQHGRTKRQQSVARQERWKSSTVSDNDEQRLAQWRLNEMSDRNKEPPMEDRQAPLKSHAFEQTNEREFMCTFFPTPHFTKLLEPTCNVVSTRPRWQAEKQATERLSTFMGYEMKASIFSLLFHRKRRAGTATASKIYRLETPFGLVWLSWFGSRRHTIQ